MTPERWEKINAIFAEVVTLPPDERQAYFNSRGTDPTLQVEVEALLQSDESDEFLEPTPLRKEASISNVDGNLGRQIGPYEIKELIGAGGMGNVYLAARKTDYEQQVAIKLIKRGMSTEGIISRFRAEVQFLAVLGRHPNIAALHDAGVTEDDLPYFVMEHVQGERIDHYCNRHRLNIRQRLQLFRQVCEAVQFAHQHTIIHRDIKPSNLLVREDGTVKLIDFGIAKLTSPGSDLSMDSLTRSGFQPLTPNYASPEQLNNEPLSTGSDVYSLGMVLYELLTGSRPYSLRAEAVGNLAHFVSDQTLTRPSTSVGKAVKEDITQATSTPLHRLRRQLAGDLDTIVLMALRKEPERRYASVEQFSSDIERHLNGLPVLARKDTFGYRLSRYIKRHRTAILASTIFILMLIIGTIGSATGWVKAIHERDRADKKRIEAEKAELKATEINRFFMKHVLAQASPEKNPVGKQLTVREALDRASKEIDTAFEQQPEVKAALYYNIGDTYYTLGEAVKAEEIARKGLALCRQLYGEEHGDSLTTLNLLAMALDYQGKIDSAEPLYRQSLEGSERVHGPEDAKTAIVRNNLAEVLRRKGELKESLRLHELNLACRRRTLGADHPDTLETMNNLAGLRYQQGKKVEAEKLFRQTWEGRKRALGEKHPLTLLTLANLGVVLKQLGKLAEAEPIYREVLKADRYVLGPEHPDTLTDMHNLAMLLLNQKKLNEATQLFRETLRLRRKVFKNEMHPHIAYTLLGLGETLLAQEKAKEAESLLREACAIRRKVLPIGANGIAHAEQLLCACLIDLKRFKESEEILLKCYQEIEHSKRPSSRAKAQIVDRLIHLYTAWDRPEDIAKWQKKKAE